MNSLDNHWGIHIALDMEDCCPDAISSEENIEIWVETLVDAIDMEAYGRPIIVRFGKDDKYGYTCVQLIQTSNIVAHFAEDDNTAYIDVFSCKDFDTDTVIEIVQSFFGGNVRNKTVLLRG